jgi:hypothetical protein
MLLFMVSMSLTKSAVVGSDMVGEDEVGVAEDRRNPDTRLSRALALRVGGPWLLSSYLDLGNGGARVFA